MKYLIIGHPRCGTGFMSKLFKHNNLDIGHELMGENGTSDWQYAIPNQKIFPWTNGTRNEHKFDMVIHNIRDPFTAIPSVVFTETPNVGEQSWRTVSEEFRRHFIKFPDNSIFDNAAHSYLGWNKIIEDQNISDKVVRIENAIEDLGGELTESLGDKKVNARKHQDMTKEQWLQISPNILTKLELFCLKYKYESIKERINKL